MSYFTGMTVRLQVTFKNFSDVETDPTTITAHWKDPSGASNSSTYVSSGTDNWTRVSAGVYYYDLAVTLPGQYSYGFQGTGAVAVYDSDTFEVRQRQVG
jgi:hypothetical protein